MKRVATDQDPCMIAFLRIVYGTSLTLDSIEA